jgi:hypothetical protein
MSLELDVAFDKKKKNQKVHVCVSPSGIVHIDNASISMEDFCGMVEYVLVNSDLRDDDPRIDLLARIKKTKKVSGYNTQANKKAKRFSVPHGIFG